MLGLFVAGSQLLRLRTGEVQDASMVQAANVRSNGAALAFAHAMSENWRQVVWLSEVIARNADIDLNETLSALVQDHRRISWAGFVTPDGTVQAASHGLLVGADVSERLWFQTGLRGDHAGDLRDAVLLSDLLGGTPDEPLRFLDFARPVVDPSGATIGVVAIHIDGAWAADFLSEIADSLEIELFIVDDDRQVKFATDTLEDDSLNLWALEEAGTNFTGGLEVWPDGRRYHSAVVRDLNLGLTPDFGWRLVGRLDPVSFEAIARRIPSEVEAMLSRDGAARMLRGVLGALALGVIGLTALAIFLRHWVDREAGRARATGYLLDRSQRRLAVIAESAALPIATLRDGVYHTANPAAVRLLGREREGDLVGRAFLDISPAGEMQQERGLQEWADFEDVLHTAQSMRVGWKHRRPDGQIAHLDVLLCEVPAENGVEVIAILQDMTSRHEADALLRDYQSHLERAVAERTEQLERKRMEQQAILNAAMVGIAVLREGVIVQTNPQLLRKFALHQTVSEVGVQWHLLKSLILPDDRAAAAADAFLRNEAYHFEDTLERQDGTNFRARVTVAPLDPAEPAAGAVWVVRDVTDEHEAGLATRKSKDIAEQAVQLKMQFLSTISHEIRTPLNAVLGFMDLAADEDDPARRSDHIAKARRSGRQVAGLLNDLLDLSRAESGRMEIETVPFHLADLAHECLESVVPAIGSAEVELVLDISPDLPAEMLGDPLRLRQILGNYLSNAAKFTNSGEIVLSVSGQHVAGDEWRLRLAVSDTGIGLSEDQAARLFSNFAQADKSTARLYGGTGLGLAICKQLAGLMGGEVGVDSAKGRGSHFWIELPMAATVPQPMTAQDPPRGAAYLAVACPRLAESLKRALHRVGLSLLTAPQADAVTIMDDREIKARGWSPETFAPGPGILLSRSMTEAVGPQTIMLRKPVNPLVLVNRAQFVLHQPSGAVVAQEVTARDARAGRPHALVADDSPMLRDLSQQLLERLGFEVTTAENGAAAVQAVLDQAFDVIFMDHQMPVVDGIEATRRIRALGTSRAGVPIIGVSGTDSPELRRLCLAVGMDEFLLKPIARKDVEKVLKERLSLDAPDPADRPV
ncbi:ATP-binding protein [Paracoccus sp. NSM]|uniref:ATP-binding protein n=1 Tax=Paracoccus sp. NSM TaxID=3457784 RepID=UPI0040372249